MPFNSKVQFKLADLLYRQAEASASIVDDPLEIWAEVCIESGTSLPLDSHEEMHAIIDSSKLADVPWQCLQTGFTDPVDESAPAWMCTTYDVWYHDPESVVSMMLENPDFDGQLLRFCGSLILYTFGIT